MITTSNLGALRSCVEPADALELFGKPFDLNEIAGTLRRALATQPQVTQ